MVRATAVEVVKLNGNEYWPGWDATKVGYICDYVDDELDEYGIAATGASPVALANMVAYRRVIHGIWSASQPNTDPEPVVWTRTLLEVRDRLSSQDATYDQVASVDTVRRG